LWLLEIVLRVVVCGPLQGKIIAHRPFTMLPFYIQDVICVIINIADIQLLNLSVTSENDQLAYENTNIRFMMNLLFTHCVYIEITTLIDT
jgi:hypothetical protein